MTTGITLTGIAIAVFLLTLVICALLEEWLDR